jgi:hypothetical protein
MEVQEFIYAVVQVIHHGHQEAEVDIMEVVVAAQITV